MSPFLPAAGWPRIAVAYYLTRRFGPLKLTRKGGDYGGPPVSGPTTFAVQHAKWQVAWINPKGKLVKHDFGTDFPKALELYTKAQRARRKAVTLRSKNVAFPPPREWADTETVIVRKGGKKYRGRKTKEPLEYREKMRATNRRGVWWCPFCISFRKFRSRKGYRVDGVFVEDALHSCPVCDISDRHGSVQKYNPLAIELSLRKSGRRRSRSRSRRRIREES